MGSASEPLPEFDVLIVGGGFGAYATLHKLQKQGLNVRVYEKGSGSGGIWYWNTYPGARVDSENPLYQFFDEEVWKDFNYTERYPGWKELKRYFKHVEKRWNIQEHVEFNKCVDTATFDESRKQWLVECTDGSETRCRWLVMAIGFASKKYTAPIKGLGDFRGECHHTGVWPQWGINLKNKRIAVIGTGASGIQTIQESGPNAKSLTVYQRTPNYCCPMNQQKINVEEEQKKKASGEYAKSLENLDKNFAGFHYGFSERNTFDDTPEQREAFYHDLLIKNGGFRYWLGNYKDMLFDDAANEEAYQFWRRAVLKRVPDPKKAELLAPAKKPHPWGTKRPSLEQNFYEVMSLPHVELVDVNSNPIEAITETGIRSADGTHREFDVIVLATGFDAVTGSLGQLDIKGTDGKNIREHWADGLRTSMGISINKFPNMFYLYGPQAPTAFANGPTLTQLQAEYIGRTLEECKKKGITRLEPTEEAEADWTKRVHEVWNNSLFPQAKSWYQGCNIPGKRIEPLNWAGGIPAYVETLYKSNENDFQGWVTAS